MRAKSTYRDVSAGKTRTMTGSSSGTASAEKSFTVYEEDYMKSLVTKHSAVIGAYKWGPSNETTTKATCLYSHLSSCVDVQRMCKSSKKQLR